MALMIETFLMLETGNARLIAVIAYISNVRNASYDECIFNGNYIACVSNIRNNVCVADLMTRVTLLSLLCRATERPCSYTEPALI